MSDDAPQPEPEEQPESQENPVEEAEAEAVPADTAADPEEEMAEKLGQARELIGRELRKVIIGQDEVVEQMLVALLSGGHCLVTGAPGLAKTLARAEANGPRQMPEPLPAHRAQRAVGARDEKPVQHRALPSWRWFLVAMIRSRAHAMAAKP